MKPCYLWKNGRDWKSLAWRLLRNLRDLTKYSDGCHAWKGRNVYWIFLKVIKLEIFGKSCKKENFKLSYQKKKKKTQETCGD